MKKNVSSKSSSSSSTALTAVALQDHWMKSLSLSDPVRPRNIPQKKKDWNKHAKSTLDTGRGKLQKKTVPAAEKEYVLDGKAPTLSLAQRLGLIERPAAMLTETQWKDVKQQSNQRDDSAAPCVICKDDFGTQEQVLLSCTHVFHRNCLEAFERFSGKKSCPMCRKEQYQKRIIHEGAREYRVKCATRIQAAWRGYVVRCWYQKLRETHPPKDPKLRKKFYEDRLHTITDRMVRSLDVDVNAFLSEIDRSLEASRDVYRDLDNRLTILTEDQWDAVQLKAVERGNTDCPICLTPLDGQGYTPMPKTTTPTNNITTTTTKKSHHQKIKLLPKHPKTLPELATRPGKSSAAQKEQGDCGCATGKQAELSRHQVLLSCSHVFHQTCLEAFEEFAEGDRKYVCPVCRARYQKKVL